MAKKKIVYISTFYSDNVFLFGMRPLNSAMIMFVELEVVVI